MLRIVFSYICILQLARASVNAVPHRGPRRPEALTQGPRFDYDQDVSGNWRVIFRFEDGDAYDVDLIDYH